jgi:FdhE protein
MLPDPARRFANTAGRLDALSSGHPMQEWLRFMARIARAQMRSATTLAPAPALGLTEVARAVDARLPPFAADGHRRSPVWRDGLAVLIESLEPGSMPREAQAVAAQLSGYDAEALEGLADAFLHGQVAPEEAGSALYIAAALQVYFTNLAASLPASALRLLPQRGRCPCCGSMPSASLVTASGQTSGARYLYCSLCSTAWNHVRAVCITCGKAHTLSLRGIEGDAGVVKAETCTGCGTYAKSLYQAKDAKADPYADDLASLGLDVLVAEAGFARHAPNPLLLVG